jgi:hypothetical protein
MRPNLTIDDILAWADEHHARIGRWPSARSGPVDGAVGETWAAINQALAHHRRGLFTAYPSLSALLAKHRKRPAAAGPLLTCEQILAWAEDHHRRTGDWPNARSGPVSPSSPLTWRAVSVALRRGLRGLPARLSLRVLLPRDPLPAPSPLRGGRGRG